MKNEEKILELLSEVLKNQDKHENQINTLIGVVARQNTALQGIARDVNDLKGMKVDLDELKRRVDELEQYVGKK